MKPLQVYTLTLRKVHATMLARGFSAQQLLAKTGVGAADFEDPYRLVHATQARQYYLNVVTLAGTSGLGLEIGCDTRLSELGSHGLMQLTSRTGQQAMTESHSHRYLYNLLLDWNVEVSDDRFVNVFASDEPPGPLHIFLIERAIGTLHSAARELIGPQARPIRVLLDYPAPGHFRQYEAAFRCPVYFSQKRTEVHYPMSYLEASLPAHDPHAHDVMGSLRTSLIKRLETRRDIVQDVVMELRRRPGEFPDLPRVAERMAMSTRTLRRKLAQAGVTFQQLLDDERRKIAEDYLANTDVSLQQVAESCGFQDARSFGQAFKRWTGILPSDYRKARG